MRTVFTKVFFPALLTVVGLAIAFTVQAQTFTEAGATGGSNQHATAMTTDHLGNVFVIVNPTGAANAKLVEYVGGAGSPVPITSSIEDDDPNNNNGAYGLACDNENNIYASTANGATNGLILKFTYPTYAQSTLVTGSGAIGYFNTIAVGPDDMLYAVQYNANGNTEGAGVGDVEVARYPTTSATVNTATVGGTPLYTDLEDAFFLGIKNNPSNYDAVTTIGGLQVDANLNIYVADGFDDFVLPTSSNGQHIYKLLKPGSGNNYTLQSTPVASNLHAISLSMNTARTNLYATVSLTYNNTYSVVEYAGGTGSPITLYTGLTNTGLYPYGLTYVSDSELFVDDGSTGPSNIGSIEIIYGAPTTQASGITFSTTTATATTINWTNGSGTNRAVFIEQGNAGSPTLSKGTTYNAASGAYTTGSTAGAGWYCVYNSTGTSVTVSGLSVNTTYRVMVVDYAGTTGVQNYDTNAGTNNPNNVTTATPTMSTFGSLSAMTATPGTASSSTSITLNATNLVANVTATVPSGFDVSLDNSTWSGSGGSKTITPSSGSIASQNVYVRLDAGDAANTYSGNLVFTSTSASTVNAAIPASTVSAPSTTISSLTAVTSTNTNAASVQYTATFAASISGLSTTDFTLNTTGVSGASVTGVSGSGTSWTVTVNTGSGGGTIQLVMNSSSGTTPSVSNLPKNGDTYTIDKTAPTVSSITATTPSNASATNATSVTYTVTFSESVTGVDATDFALTTSGTSGTVSGVSGSGTTYTVTVSSITGTGTLRLDLKSSGTGITDAAGNAISGGFTSGSVYTIDRTAPTVSSIALAESSPTKATSVDYTVTFSKPVTGVTSGAFSLVTTSGNATGAINSLTPVSTSVYTVNVTGVSGTGGLRLDLTNVSGISDLIGNQLTSTFTGSVYAIDNTPATLTSGSYFSNNGNSQQFAKVGDNLTLSVGYSEQLQSATMTIGGNPVSVSFSNSNRNFSGVYTMTSSDTEGNVGWTLSATDLAGNVRNYSNTDFGTVLIFDKTPPAISVSAPSQANANAAASVNYTVSYSDANFNFSSLGTGNITLNATGTATGTVAVSGSGTSYTVTISNTSGDGTLGFTIGAGTATDIPGNTAAASSASGTFTVDNTAPTVMISSPSVSSIGSKEGGTVSYTVTYADANFNSSTLTTANITLNATGTAGGTVGLSGSGTSYTVTISNITGSGTLGISIAAGTASDLAGNTAGAAGPSPTFNVFDATLSNLVIARTKNGNSSIAILSPAFNSATNSYSIDAPNSTSVITATPTTSNATSTIKVNGTTVASGAASTGITLNVGPNTITTIVTAQDGVTTDTYTVSIDRRNALGQLDGFYEPISVTQTPNPQFGEDGIMVHPALSPNGDGINDVFTIDGLTAYPDNKVTIMNRDGVVVFQTKGYDNSSKVFDGHSSVNGVMQLPGTYFYSLEYKVGGDVKSKTGFIVLKW